MNEETNIDVLKDELIGLISKYAKQDLYEFTYWPVEHVAKKAGIEVRDSSKEIINIIKDIDTEEALFTLIRKMIRLFEEYPDRQEQLSDLIFNYQFREEWT